MESRAISDSQISASTEFSDDYAAHQARLRVIEGGWASLLKDNNQWLQVDLLRTTRVTGIATQGKNASQQWITEYKLEYGEDGQTFTFYIQNGDKSDTVRLYIASLKSLRFPAKY